MAWVIFIGLAAAVLTTIAFLPQVIKSLKTRQTRDISLITYLIFTTSLFLWLVYGLSIMDLPLIIPSPEVTRMKQVPFEETSVAKETLEKAKRIQ